VLQQGYAFPEVLQPIHILGQIAIENDRCIAEISTR
jgi:hypothetical protein